MDYESYSELGQRQGTGLDSSSSGKRETEHRERRPLENHSKNDKKSKYRKLFLQRAQIRIKKAQS